MFRNTGLVNIIKMITIIDTSLFSAFSTMNMIKVTLITQIPKLSFRQIPTTFWACLCFFNTVSNTYFMKEVTQIIHSRERGSTQCNTGFIYIFKHSFWWFEKYKVSFHSKVRLLKIHAEVESLRARFPGIWTGPP